MDKSLALTVGGVPFPTGPIMIGAGACKTPATAADWLKVAPVVSGSFTPEAQDGNTGDQLFFPDTLESLLELGFGLNSFGMPNCGFKEAANAFSEANYENPLMVSIAGFRPSHYLSGIETFSAISSIAAIECNFGCPNVGHGRILSFDVATLEDLFERMSDSEKPIWVKFSPYSDPAQLTAVADLVNMYSHRIQAVVTCNTFPNGFTANAISTSANNGYGGVSGRALKQIALGQVKRFRTELKPEIDVIGVGGITTGDDVIEFLEAGATAVQLTSLPYWLGSPSKFWEYLLPEENKLADYLREKYYA